MAVLRMWIDLVTTEATLELQGLDQNHSFSHRYTWIERLSAFGPRLTRCSLNSLSYRPESLVATQVHLYRPFEQVRQRIDSIMIEAPSILQAIDLNRSLHYKPLQLDKLSAWLNLLFFDTSTLNVRAPSDRSSPRYNQEEPFRIFSNTFVSNLPEPQKSALTYQWSCCLRVYDYIGLSIQYVLFFDPLGAQDHGLPSFKLAVEPLLLIQFKFIDFLNLVSGSISSSSYRPESLVATQVRPRIDCVTIEAPSILQAIGLNRSLHYKYTYIELTTEIPSSDQAIELNHLFRSQYLCVERSRASKHGLTCQWTRPLSSQFCSNPSCLWPDFGTTGLGLSVHLNIQPIALKRIYPERQSTFRRGLTLHQVTSNGDGRRLLPWFLLWKWWLNQLTPQPESPGIDSEKEIRSIRDHRSDLAPDPFGTSRGGIARTGSLLAQRETLRVLGLVASIEPYMPGFLPAPMRHATPHRIPDLLIPLSESPENP
ncbi:hypothetical protein B0H10DRAFT_1950070 [Mycena sp. CBHHK59/15]|nr:hypothetical protein B0H10DRAFT_1950070 [Mycena sp. CBHHK59/15]